MNIKNCRCSDCDKVNIDLSNQDCYRCKQESDNLFKNKLSREIETYLNMENT